MFWARVLEGKLPPCDEDKKEGTKRKKGCGSGDTCCSEKKKKVVENGEVQFPYNDLLRFLNAISRNIKQIVLQIYDHCLCRFCTRHVLVMKAVIRIMKVMGKPF